MRNGIIIVLAVALATGGLVILSTDFASAHVVPRPCDFTTGGGWIFNGNFTGEKTNFGLVAGCKHEGFFGHVNIVDRGPFSFDPTLVKLHVSSTSIDAYFEPAPGPPPSGYRDICGTARTNLSAPNDTVKFRVRTKDNGEPGGLDRFGYKLTNPSTGKTFTRSTRELGPEGEKGGGGNIQFHPGNKSNTPPAADPDEITACGSDDSGLGF